MPGSVQSSGLASTGANLISDLLTYVPPNTSGYTYVGIYILDPIGGSFEIDAPHFESNMGRVVLLNIRGSMDTGGIPTADFFGTVINIFDASQGLSLGGYLRHATETYIWSDSWSGSFRLGAGFFTSAGETVNFNALSDAQKTRIDEVGANGITNALSGDDTIHLPNRSNYQLTDRVSWLNLNNSLFSFSAGGGDDTVYGGDGGDRVDGGIGVDHLYGNDGDDTFWGGQGSDRLEGGIGQDKLHGDEDGDTIIGGEDADVIYGGAGDDQLSAGGDLGGLSGADFGGNKLYGEGGKDTLVSWNSKSGATADLLDGGSGMDTYFVDHDAKFFDRVANVEIGEQVSALLFTAPRSYTIYSSDAGTKINLFDAAGAKTAMFWFDNRISPAQLTIGRDPTRFGELVTVTREYSETDALNRIAAGIAPKIAIVSDYLVRSLMTAGSQAGELVEARAFKFVREYFGPQGVGKGLVLDTLLALGIDFTQQELGTIAERLSKKIGDAVLAEAIKDLNGGRLDNYDNDLLELANDIVEPLTGISPLLNGVVFLSEHAHNAIVAAMDLYFQGKTSELLQSLPDGSAGEIPIIDYGDRKVSFVNDASQLSIALGSDGVDHVFSTVAIALLPGNVENVTLLDRPLASSLSAQTGIKEAYAEASGAVVPQILNGNDLANELTGNSLANSIAGLVGNDRLYGNGGDDILDGGDGNDLLDGGSGADILNGGVGTDTASYEASDNAVTVNLQLGLGFGGAAHGDTYSSIENAVGGAGDDVLIGTEVDNRLTGGRGNDTLDGGAGQDTLNGGAGDDIFYIDNALDVVEELRNGGTDRVFASVSYTLAAGASVERITTTDHTGTSAINLTGNETAQDIVGNDGNNVLDGGGGADWMYGRLGNDTFHVHTANDRAFENAGQGYDTVLASVTYALQGGTSVERLATTNASGTATINLTGNEFSQDIVGNAGNNVLSGGGGDDWLYGGLGNDIFFVDGANDKVFDDGGIDGIYVNVSYVLHSTANVEALSADFLGGTSAINLTGNHLAQEIWGNIGNNYLDGKEGSDTLYGLGGLDIFGFTTALGANNIDRIHGFVASEDKIQLSGDVFSAITPGALSSGAFTVGSAATSAEHRIIYNSQTGAILYDADGSGAGAAVQFATVDGGLALTASNFGVTDRTAVAAQKSSAGNEEGIPDWDGFIEADTDAIELGESFGFEMIDQSAFQGLREEAQGFYVDAPRFMLEPILIQLA